MAMHLGTVVGSVDITNDTDLRIPDMGEDDRMNVVLVIGRSDFNVSTAYWDRHQELSKRLSRLCEVGFSVRHVVTLLRSWSQGASVDIRSRSAKD